MSTKSSEKTRTGAVIVAAGLSSRMNAFKPMLPLAGATVIRTLIGTLRQAGVELIVVVTGRNSEELSEHIADLGVETIRNADYASTDMFHSACLGFARLKGRCEQVFFMPGDVPLFSPYSIIEMLEYMKSAEIEVLTPCYNGKAGHPVLLSAKAIPSLTSYSGPFGLKGAIQGYEGSREVLALPDQGLVMDADDPADYAKLLEYARAKEQREQPHCEISVMVAAGGPFFDEKMAELLELTDRYGSLARACRQADISYSNGWKKVRQAEEELGFLLVRSTRGGPVGGGSVLTKRGKAYLTAYKKFRASMMRFGKKQFQKYFG